MWVISSFTCCPPIRSHSRTTWTQDNVLIPPRGTPELSFLPIFPISFIHFPDEEQSKLFENLQNYFQLFTTAEYVEYCASRLKFGIVLCHDGFQWISSRIKIGPPPKPCLKMENLSRLDWDWVKIWYDALWMSWLECCSRVKIASLSSILSKVG